MNASAVPSLAIVGLGKVGRLLACLAHAHGVPLHAVVTRDPARATQALRELGVEARTVCRLAEAGTLVPIDTVLIALTVSEDALPQVVRDLSHLPSPAAEVTVIHCAGPLDSSVLTPLQTAWESSRVHLGSWHPLRSVVDPAAAAKAFTGTTCAIEGDAQGVATLLAFTARVQGSPVTLPTDAKAHYHAAAVMASNYLVALADQAATLLTRADMTPAAALALLLPLMNGTLQNLATNGLPAALTGPIERGDASTLRLHLQALKDQPPLTRDLYRQLGLAALRVAKQKGLPEDRADMIFALLSGL